MHPAREPNGHGHRRGGTGRQGVTRRRTGVDHRGHDRATRLRRVGAVAAAEDLLHGVRERPVLIVISAIGIAPGKANVVRPVAGRKGDRRRRPGGPGLAHQIRVVAVPLGDLVEDLLVGRAGREVDHRAHACGAGPTARIVGREVRLAGAASRSDGAKDWGSAHARGAVRANGDDAPRARLAGCAVVVTCVGRRRVDAGAAPVLRSDRDADADVRSCSRHRNRRRPTPVVERHRGCGTGQGKDAAG